jgi:hypothetical protein
MRARLQHLEAQVQHLKAKEEVEEEWRSMMGRLETCAAKVHDGLQQADLHTRRAIMRSLVKRVEVEQQHLRVVFRVSPTSVPPSSDNVPHNWPDSGRCVYPCALQRHAWAVLGHEPSTEGKQRRGEGAKGTPCRRALAVSAVGAHTRRHGGRMPLETTTHRVPHWHRGVLLYEGDITGGQTTGLRLQVR